MDGALHARLRVVAEEAAKLGFCIVIAPKDDGRWSARAYCLGSYKGDFEETAESEPAVIAAVMRHLETLKRETAGSPAKATEASEGVRHGGTEGTETG
jgi:hypothetical protein